LQKKLSSIFLIEQLLLQRKTDAKRRLLYFQHGRPEISGASRTVSAFKHKTPGLFDRAFSFSSEAVKPF
jgi:hypothetical protein